MPTEGQILKNLYDCGATIYQWNVFDSHRGELVLRVYIPLDTDNTTE